MMFKERWAFVGIILVTVMLVYMIPLGSITHYKCSCPKQHNCNQDVLVQRDMIIHSNQHFENHTQINEYLKHHIKQPLKLSPNLHDAKDLKKDGWVLDCITWETKWESPTLDADPHDFTLDDLPENKDIFEDDSHREKTFIEIFKKKDWPANDPSYGGLQASGPGAMLKNAQGVMAALHVIITKLKAHLNRPVIKLLDLPCGDLQWMRKFLLTRNDIDYTGADIVPELIAHHKRKHADLQRSRFIVHDIVKSPLNESFDLILSRDLLQHLWRGDAMRALMHFSMSSSHHQGESSHYLLATTFPDTSTNKDVERDALGGRKFSYNLELPPFSLAPPVCSSYDWNVEHLGLWELPLKQKYDI